VQLSIQSKYSSIYSAYSPISSLRGGRGWYKPEHAGSVLHAIALLQVSKKGK